MPSICYMKIKRQIWKLKIKTNGSEKTECWKLKKNRYKTTVKCGFNI